VKTRLGLLFAVTALVFGIALLVLALVDGFHLTEMQNILPLP
jgi:ABC-type tungstate transport system substrate-binding protein